MKNETARREIESLDYYLQNHTNDYSEESHMAMMMAIKALEQQPCEDCISREAVRRILANERDELVKLHTVNPKDNPKADAMAYGVNWSLNTLMDLPSVTPQQTMWIPVSERLPKENEYIGNVCKYYLIQDEYGDMHVAHLSNIGWIPMGSLKAIGDEIIAWQELPEPYKAESEDKE